MRRSSDKRVAVRKGRASRTPGQTLINQMDRQNPRSQWSRRDHCRSGVAVRQPGTFTYGLRVVRHTLVGEGARHLVAVPIETMRIGSVVRAQLKSGAVRTNHKARSADLGGFRAKTKRVFVGQRSGSVRPLRARRRLHRAIDGASRVKFPTGLAQDQALSIDR